MLATQIVDAVRRTIGNSQSLVLLHEPYLPANTSRYVQECIDTGWVSSAGTYVTKFESQLAEFTGSARAIAVVNGTVALQLCFQLVGVERDDEIVCPSLSFVATANAISHCGAVPHFVDVDLTRMSMCPESLAKRLALVGRMESGRLVNRETGRRIAAVCPVHCLGHSADILELLDVCQRFGLPLVEDAAESLGSYCAGRHTGTFGRISAVSFNGNKILTTGGGGAILTNDEVLADRAKHLSTTAKVAHPWDFFHDEVAYNYRLPNINAALGCSQLEVLSETIAAKRRIADAYAESFRLLEEVDFIKEPSGSTSNYWLNGFILKTKHASIRDDVLRALNAANYQSRPLWQPIHTFPMYSHCPRGLLQNTESLCARTITIPSSAQLSARLARRPMGEGTESHPLATDLFPSN
jgi:perosamine synthetase